MDKNIEELEAGVIGRIILFPYELINAIDLGLKPEHFEYEFLGEIYSQMVEKYLEKGSFETAEIDYDYEELMDLTQFSILNIENSIKEVLKNFKNRKFEIELKQILGSDDKLEKKINKVLGLVNDLENLTTAKNEFFDLSDLVKEYLSDKEEAIIKMPYKTINEYFTLEKESLITIGARPAMGKTSFALNLAYKLGKTNNALYVNLEMGKKAIINRIWGIEAMVNYHKIEKKIFTDAESSRISFAINELNKSKMKILDCQDTNFEKVIEQIRRKHEKFHFDAIVIDYLTLMRPSKNFGNRNNEVEYMANKLKSLAKELDTCIVILAQLNRANEERKDKRPILSDLRDSGGIEQASNVVAFLHREDYYTGQRKNEESTLEFVIRKNRNGNTGIVKLGYNLDFQKITDDTY